MNASNRQSNKLPLVIAGLALAGVVAVAGIKTLQTEGPPKPELPVDSPAETSRRAPAAPMVTRAVQPPITETAMAAGETNGREESSQSGETRAGSPQPVKNDSPPVQPETENTVATDQTADSGTEQPTENSPAADSGLLSDPDGPPGDIHQLKGHRDSLHGVAILPDGRRALSAGDDRTIRFWDLSTGRESAPPITVESHINDLAVSPDGQKALVAGRHGAALLWDLEARKQLHRLVVNGGELLAVNFFNNGKLASTGGADGTARIWDVESGKELLKIAPGVGRVLEVQFTPDARQILCSGTDSHASLFDAKTGKELQRYEGHTGRIYAVTPLRSGRQFLSGSSDGSIRLWDVKSGKELRRFEGHTGEVFGIEVIPGERHFLSSGSEGTLHVWDIRTGAEIHQFKAPTHCTGYFAVSPNGRFAISGFGAYPNPSRGAYLKDGDFAVHLWRLPKLVQPELAKVPDEEAQKQAEQQIREIFKQEYAGAKQPAELAELAETLLQQARKSEDHAARFVLLREARDLANAAGDVRTALDSVDELAQTFQVNPLQLKADVLESARRAARSDEVVSLVADSALSVIDEAIRAEEFDIGSELNSVARMAGRRIKDRELIDRVSTARDRIIDRRREFQEFEDASDKLSTTPNDEDASRVRGLYLCLRRNNWAEGLPLLQRSGHEEFEKIAELELMYPTEPADQLKLADAWWNRAEATRGSQQNAVRSRALYWYERVLPELSGLEKTAVERKISAARNPQPGP